MSRNTILQDQQAHEDLSNFVKGKRDGKNPDLRIAGLQDQANSRSAFGEMTYLLLGVQDLDATSFSNDLRTLFPDSRLKAQNNGQETIFTVTLNPLPVRRSKRHHHHRTHQPEPPFSMTTLAQAAALNVVSLIILYKSGFFSLFQ